MFSRILGVNTKSFFPVGYEVKIGTLPFSKLDGKKYIPLIAKCTCSARNGSCSISDNNNKTYLNSNLWRETTYVSTTSASATVSIMSLYNYNWEELKTIRSYRHNNGGDQSSYTGSCEIVVWLEKVGA